MQATDLPRIADIIPPQAPEPATNLLAYVVVIAVILLALAAIHTLSKSTQAKLMRIRRQLRTQKISSRQAALGIRALLKQHNSAGCKDNHQWQAFCTQLQQACFSSNTPDTRAIDELVRQSREWLRQSNG